MATNRRSRLAEIYRSEKTKGGGVASTLGKATAEKLDPRQMFNQKGFLAEAFPALFKAYKAASSSVTKSNSGNVLSLTKQATLLNSQMKLVAVNTTIIAKNTMVLPSMARDMNLMRQNIAKLVKLQGESASRKADMFFKTAKERESAYESKFKKEGGGKKSVASTGTGSSVSVGDGKTSGLASILKVLADSVSKGLGIAAVGAGIGGFFVGLAAGGAAVTALGGASGVKDMLVNLAEGLSAFNTQSMVTFGALLVGGAIFGSYASAGSMIKAPIGMAAVGLGIGAFFSGLAAGGYLGTYLENSAGIKDMMVNLAEGLGAFNTQSLIAFGALLGTGALFGSISGGASDSTLKVLKKTGGAALGMTMIGLGLGGFLAGLSVGGEVIERWGNPAGVKSMLVAFAEGLNAFNTNSLLALGGLLATGIFLPGAGALGIVSIGFAIAAFLVELAAGDKLIEWISGENAGGKIKTLLENFAGGIKSFEGLDSTKLGQVASVIGNLGGSLFKFFAGEGSGGFFGIVDSVNEKFRSLLGLEQKMSPVQQLTADLNKLNSEVDYNKLTAIGKGLIDLTNGFKYFSGQPGAPTTPGPGTPNTSTKGETLAPAPTMGPGFNRMTGASTTPSISKPAKPATSSYDSLGGVGIDYGDVATDMMGGAASTSPTPVTPSVPAPVTPTPVAPPVSNTPTAVTAGNLSSSVPMKDYGTYTPAMRSYGKLKNVAGSIMHHTGGHGITAAINTLKGKKQSYHYIIGRDGTITQLLPEGAIGQHILGGDRSAAVKHLNNSNTIGISLEANNDADVTPEQINAATALNAELARKFGYPETSVWGHGEIQKGKMPDEGKRAVMAIRSSPNLDQNNPTQGSAIASASGNLSNGTRGLSAPNITVVAPSVNKPNSQQVSMAPPVDNELMRNQRLLSRQTALMA